MGNNTSSSVLHNIDSVVTRLASRTRGQSSSDSVTAASAASGAAGAGSDDQETAARQLVADVLRASVKEVLRQQLRAAAVAVAAPAGAAADPFQAEAERLVAATLDAALDIVVADIVPDPKLVNGPVKCKTAVTQAPVVKTAQQQQQQQQQQQPDPNEPHMVFLNEIASRMVNSRLKGAQLSSAVEQLSMHQSVFHLPQATVDLGAVGPYLHCLAHAGVVDSAVSLLVFDAARLPDSDAVRGYDGIVHQLTAFLFHSLRQLKTEAYALVFLHSASTRSQFPKVSWFKQAAEFLESRQGLRRVYVLHNTFSLRALSVMSRAFTSRAFRDKVVPVSSVEQLSDLLPQLEGSGCLDGAKAWETAHKGFGF